MSLGRIVIASLVGGLAAFVWGAVAHMALPIGEMGMSNLPGEQMILPAFRFNIKEHGFYMFPGMPENDASEAAMKSWEEKCRQGPSGLLIIRPNGEEPMSARQLGVEYASSALAASFLALVLARIRGGVFAKAMIGAAFGLFAWLSIDVSYWNWYSFPTAKAIGSMIEQGVGGLVTGWAVALVLGRDRPPAVVPA